MRSVLSQSARVELRPLRQKLVCLGVNDEWALEAVERRIRVRGLGRRGDDILAPGGSSKHSTLLIEGIACSYNVLTNGRRQIYAFHYAGDLCDLSRLVLPGANTGIAVAAITDCTVGFIENRDIEQLVAQYPSLALALWRASILEASMFRERLCERDQPALQRVAHLLCEQLIRREAVGITSAIVPFSQMDLADASGLSIVHISRTFKELLGLGIVAKAGRVMKVVDRERLMTLAAFDGAYLNAPQLLPHWSVKIEGPLLDQGKRVHRPKFGRRSEMPIARGLKDCSLGRQAGCGAKP